jgi:hypothetical protein
MNGIAVLAVKGAAVASGLGASLLPGVAPSAIEGFAVGSLLSGVCLLLVIAPRRILRVRRGQPQLEDDMQGNAALAPAQVRSDPIPAPARPNSPLSAA